MPMHDEAAETMPAEETTVTDLLGLRALNDLLRQRNVLFDTAINKISQGLCFFDGRERLIVCNERYATMYRLPPALMKPGTPLNAILDYRFDAGTGPAMNRDEFYAWRQSVARSDRAADTQVHLQDGRTIEIRHEPMPDQGWVATHEDVTARRLAEITLTEQRCRLNAALDNMPHGLAMFDADARLILCNPRYASMYDLPTALVCEGVPMEDILSYRRSIGNAPLGPETGDRMNCGSRIDRSSRVELEDGRVMEIDRQSMAGGGVVTVHQDITAALEAQAEIVRMARHDALTGLPNRVLFREELERALARIAYGEMFAVLYIDLDRFKIVNDTLGHLVGDRLLQRVTERLLLCVSETDKVARLGGDEFGVVQLGRGVDVAADLANRIVAVLSEPYDVDGHQIVIGTSVGIAAGEHDVDADHMLKNADLALYRAKTEGRGTFRHFERSMEEAIQSRRDLEIELRSAFSEGQFELFYQPVVNLAAGAVRCCEALLRWRHPVRGFVSPAEFIPVAEDIGLIVPLGAWILRTACLEAATWPRDIKVAVNVSPIQVSSRAFVQTVIRSLAKSRLDPHRLELEITESVRLNDSDNNLGTLQQILGLGVGIALDDFGTGNSSLSYLHTFPFSKIKIDKTFVQDVGSRAECAIIVKAIADLGTLRGIETTAEGIETEEQLQRVRALGCSEAQGFFLGRPVPASEIAGCFRRSHGGREPSSKAG